MNCCVGAISAQNSLSFQNMVYTFLLCTRLLLYFTVFYSISMQILLLSTVFCHIAQTVEAVQVSSVWAVVVSSSSERLLSAGHDVSDGGLVSCLLEMAFAGNRGLDVELSSEGAGGRSVKSELRPHICPHIWSWSSSHSAQKNRR